MTSLPFSAAMERGVQAHRDGRLDEASSAYRDALAIAPGDAEANSLYGLVLVHLGRFEEAEAFLLKALDLEAEVIGFRMNLAELYERTGRTEQAIDLIREGLVTQPQAPHAWERLGDLYIKQLRAGEAAAAYAGAMEYRQDADLAVKRARAELAAGRPDTALGILRALSMHHPDHQPMLALTALIHARRNDWVTLESASLQWTRLHPRDAEAWRNLAMAGFELGRYHLALSAYGKVLEFQGRDASDLTIYGRIALFALEFETARQALDEAEALDPEDAAMLAARATLLTYRGEFDAALECCRRCLQREPEYAPAYTLLSRLVHGRFSEPEMETLSRLATREDGHADQRIPAAFALAHGLDARQETAAAFAAYERAHALALERNAREGRVFDPALTSDRTTRFIELFNRAPASGGLSVRTPVPVFIVGMPRSGTTLVESVLAAHSRVFACGERPQMQQILSACLQLKRNGTADLEPAYLDEWRRAYLAELPDTASADLVTDKHPLNFEAIGLIANLFPNARIVHVRRDPVETGLSIYCNELSKFWAFAHRLGDIGCFYGHYARLMSHWDQLLPGRIIHVDYQNFAGDFSAQSRRLVAACGLEWEPACEHFQGQSRPIATLSAVQARGPVRPHTGRAQRYAPYLAPLLDSLRAANLDPRTGTLLSPGQDRQAEGP